MADLNFDVASGDTIAELNEKLGGRFRLKLSANLSPAKKFERFAEESSAFHLHKKRIFIKKVLETFSKKKRKKRKQRILSYDEQVDSSITRNIMPQKTMHGKGTSAKAIGTQLNQTILKTKPQQQRIIELKQLASTALRSPPSGSLSPKSK